MPIIIIEDLPSKLPIDIVTTQSFVVAANQFFCEHVNWERGKGVYKYGSTTQRVNNIKLQLICHGLPKASELIINCEISEHYDTWIERLREKLNEIRKSKIYWEVWRMQLSYDLVVVNKGQIVNNMLHH